MAKSIIDDLRGCIGIFAKSLRICVMRCVLFPEFGTLWRVVDAGNLFRTSLRVYPTLSGKVPSS
ncbi:MAG: hypothetical protein VX936_08980, partial [Planctomycetota bacterium]|nr:hypothetical protein [Planctomycetota bacterium]